VEFVRKGVMHRNIYVNAPEVLDRSLRVKGTDNLRLAGQITGGEGYVESVAMGMVSSLAFAAELTGRGLPKWPRETAIGSLIYRLGDDTVKKFQPTNVNLGIFPKLEARIKQKPDRCRAVAEIAFRAMEEYLSCDSWIVVP
ncbi:MAG: FAD-dependent oxidoreductase, partial [Dethiosulfovibrio sp.]|nr:FAD-dependent oxidoreductase [Dethiosulfovibrio sp.]